VTAAYSWEELAQATLRRQLPAAVDGAAAGRVGGLVRRTGPVQSQVARSPYVGLAARSPGLTYADVEAAYATGALVRGSNLRGTVHTSTPEQHELLDAVTRRSLAGAWRRALGLQRTGPDDVRAALERFATGAWRTPEELREHLALVVTRTEGEEAGARARAPGLGRAMAHLHGGLVRAPLSGSGFDRQTAPGYRLADEVLGRDRSAVVADPHAALVELCRGHVRWHGPSSRRDIAWWSGDRLGDVDAALAEIADELVGRPGPDGETYLDLAEGAPSQDPVPGPRLLPEFDALVVAYAPKARVRFADEAHLPWFWTQANGLFSCVLLLDGRLRGSWRLVGTGRRRVLELRTFPGERPVDPGDLTDPVRALATVLACEVTDVRVTRAVDTP
jgi:hypothetical protein